MTHGFPDPALVQDDAAFRLESPRPSHSWGYGFHAAKDLKGLFVIGLIFGLAVFS